MLEEGWVLLAAAVAEMAELVLLLIMAADTWPPLLPTSFLSPGTSGMVSAGWEVVEECLEERPAREWVTACSPWPHTRWWFSQSLCWQKGPQ